MTGFYGQLIVDSDIYGYRSYVELGSGRKATVLKGIVNAFGHIGEGVGDILYHLRSRISESGGVFFGRSPVPKHRLPSGVKLKR